MKPEIVILGWGSLVWDARPEFDEQHDDWKSSGPALPLEFSRVSPSRENALTLVVDEQNGSACSVFYAVSRRRSPEDAIADLRRREGTTVANIGYCFLDGSRNNSKSQRTLSAINSWASDRAIDVVLWTDLSSNFKAKSSHKCEFTVAAALAHLHSLPANGKDKAAEYIWRAPPVVDTPLRRAVQVEPWFKERARLISR
jgi:hypothetical protein